MVAIVPRVPQSNEVKGTPPLRSPTPQQTRWSQTKVALLAITVLAVSTGCSSDEVRRGFLPGYSDGPVTNHTDRITNLWVGSWIAALAVGLIVWGLTIWCIIVYRKRRNDNVAPVQTRYHMPLEIMYIVVPFIMVVGLFYFTARDMAEIRDTDGPVDIKVQVIAKQWSWDFNYFNEESELTDTPDVHLSGIQAFNVGSLGGDTSLGGEPGTDESLPTLFLPVGANVEIVIDSRDVIHSFWVPAFLDKLDAIPHRTNVMHLQPLREGYYAGKCAELCGQHHGAMLLNVAVVSQERYDDEMRALAADPNRLGHVSVDGYSRSQSEPVGIHDGTGE